MDPPHVPGFLVTMLKCLLTVDTLVVALPVQLLVLIELNFSPEVSPALPLTAEMRMCDMESLMSPQISIVNCCESAGQTCQLFWSPVTMLLVI